MKKNMFLLILTLLLWLWASPAMADDGFICWFPPEWKTKPDRAQVITNALSERSGIQVQPRIAKSYPEILDAFAAQKPALVFVGSFVQTILHAKGEGVPLVQAVDGREFYSGILIYPKGQDPAAILKDHPRQVAYAAGASSGESTAKAATGGKASIPTPNHGATAGAVKSGKAKAGVVKNWWWEDNKLKYSDLEAYAIPGLSEIKNPDHVLTASRSVPAETSRKVLTAAIACREAFGAKEMLPFDVKNIQFSFELMKKGNIDPKSYKWN